MFHAGGGLVERLARVPLGVRGLPVAAEDSVRVVLTAADKCKGARADWSPRVVDSVAAKVVEQDAAYVLGLLDATGNALTLQLRKQLFQPQVVSDQKGA